MILLHRAVALVTQTTHNRAAARALRRSLRPGGGASGPGRSPPGFPARAEGRRRRGGSPRIATHAPSVRPPAYAHVQVTQTTHSRASARALRRCLRCGRGALHQERSAQPAPARPQRMARRGGSCRVAAHAPSTQRPRVRRPDPAGAPCAVVRQDLVAAITFTEQFSSPHHGEQNCSVQVLVATRSRCAISHGRWAWCCLLVRRPPLSPSVR